MKSIYFTSSLFLFSMLASAQIVNVSNATELQNALNAATPGQTIQLASGVYNKSGGFTINAGVNGSAQNPITVKGNKNTIISSNSTATGNGLWLKGNSYWILDGFTVYKSKKAIMLDNSHHRQQLVCAFVTPLLMLYFRCCIQWCNSYLSYLTKSRPN